MQIVGRGFVARNLVEWFGERHPGVTALAAGVSSTSVIAAAELDREAELLYRTLQTCRAQGRTMLFFSTASFAMYGSTSAPAEETGPLCPPSIYGRHKLALESCVRSAGAEFLILRLSHLVGPHQRGHQILPGLADQVRSGTVTLYEDAFRDLLDVRDLMSAVEALVANGVTGQVVNVVSGVLQPVGHIVDAIERRLGVTADRVYRPSRVTHTLVSTRKLRHLAPQLASWRPGPGYLDDLIERYRPAGRDRFDVELPARAGLVH
jgi:NDP-hexose 4-ketoreductase